MKKRDKVSQESPLNFANRWNDPGEYHKGSDHLPKYVPSKKEKDRYIKGGDLYEQSEADKRQRKYEQDKKNGLVI